MSFGHQYLFKGRKYQDWVEKLNDLADQMELESDPKDKFETALIAKLRDQAVNCELAASVERESYEDRN